MEIIIVFSNGGSVFELYQNTGINEAVERSALVLPLTDDQKEKIGKFIGEQSRFDTIESISINNPSCTQST